MSETTPPGTTGLEDNHQNSNSESVDSGNAEGEEGFAPAGNSGSNTNSSSTDSKNHGKKSKKVSTTMIIRHASQNNGNS